MSNQKAQTPEIILEFRSLFRTELKELGIPSSDLDQASNQLVSRFCKMFGGSMIYIPKGLAVATESRNDLIIKEFNGRNISELARKYGICVQQAYRIVGAKRKSAK